MILTEEKLKSVNFRHKSIVNQSVINHCLISSGEINYFITITVIIGINIHRSTEFIGRLTFILSLENVKAVN